MGLDREFRDAAEIAYQETQFRLLTEELGLKSGSVAGVIDRSAAATINNYNKNVDAADRRSRDGFQDAMFVAMLNEWNNALAELDRDIARREADLSTQLQTLIQSYGEDFDDLFYVEIFGEEPPQDMSMDEKLDALAEVMLENGSVRAEYSDHPLAGYLQDRQALEARRGLRTDLAEAILNHDEERANEITEDLGFGDLASLQINNVSQEVHDYAREERMERAAEIIVEEDNTGFSFAAGFNAIAIGEDTNDPEVEEDHDVIVVADLALGR